MQQNFNFVNFEIIYFFFVISLSCSSFRIPQPHSWRHRSCFQQVGGICSLFPQSGFGFSYPAVSYIFSEGASIFCDGEHCFKVYSVKLMAGLQ